MPRDKIDFDTVRRIALSLSEVEESTTYRSPALKVRGKLLACIPIHKSAEPGSVRARALSRIHPDALRDLLSMAWLLVTTKTAGRKRTTGKQKDSGVRGG